MLTTEDKLKIYDLLTSKFNINEKYPLSAVGKELSMSRIRCRSYGFRHMKDLMAAMPEFCTLEEYEYEGHSNCNVTLHEWQDKPEPDQASKTYPSWFMANKPSSDNRKTSKEEDDGPIVIRRARTVRSGDYVSPAVAEEDEDYSYRDESRDSSGSRSGAFEEQGDHLYLTDSVKESIYQVLLEKFTPGQPQHLTAVSRYLLKNGYRPELYGFDKIRNLLSEMPEYVQLVNTGKNPPANILVTVLPGKQRQKAPTADEDPAYSEGVTPQTDTAVPAAPAETGKTNDQIVEEALAKVNKPRYDQDEEEDSREDSSSNIRSSSGSMRFASDREQGGSFTFKDKDDNDAADPENESRQPASRFEQMVYFSPKLQTYLMNMGIPDPITIIRSSYEDSIKEQTFVKRPDSITFPVKWEPAPGMVAVLKRSIRKAGRPWYLGYIDYPDREQEADDEEEKEDDLGDNVTRPGKALEHFADLGYWQDFLRELAGIALTENWDDNERRFGRFYILKKYIQYTFYRLLQEDKVCVSEDQKFAAFNTGLVNNHFDDIYACFTPNTEGAEGSPKWKFEAFVIAGIRGKDGYGKLLTNYFNPLPKQASYFDNKQDMFYDPNCELVTDYDHIILDNLNRLPLGYLRECCYGDQQAQDGISRIENAGTGERRKQAYYELSQYIEENDKIYRRLRSRMEDAIDFSLKKVRWNFRTAIPCYFPKGNSMSMMLPLCLEDDDHIDAALVVKKNPSGSYQGQTVLQLDRAYLDARLVCKPYTDWLKPGQNPEEQTQRQTRRFDKTYERPYEKSYEKNYNRPYEKPYDRDSYERPYERQSRPYTSSSQQSMNRNQGRITKNSQSYRLKMPDNGYRPRY